VYLKSSVNGTKKTNKAEDIKQINFIVLQNNRHPLNTLFGIVHKASGNCLQRPI
jgi:hypothetical protein